MSGDNFGGGDQTGLPLNKLRTAVQPSANLGYGAGRLLEEVKDFEYLARVDVDVVLKTCGKVKLVIRDADSERQQTKQFVSLNEAYEWVREQLRG